MTPFPENLMLIIQLSVRWNQQRSIFYAVKAHGIRGGLSKIMVLQSYVVASFAV